MKKQFLKLFYLFALSLASCLSPQEKTKDSMIDQTQVQDVLMDSSKFFSESELPLEITISETEKKLQLLGLVDLNTVDSTILVDIRYATENNFMKMNVYGDFNKAWLQPEVAEKLKNAQDLLKAHNPEYSLIIFDAARPLPIQQKMWDLVDMPISEKSKYLSNPARGSVHNYGAAVDLSIVDGNGEELDMGTAFDYFGDEAQPIKENEMLVAGKITEEQINHRKLLRKVMRTAGFSNIPAEWWHFNACNREEAQRRYPLIK